MGHLQKLATPMSLTVPVAVKPTEDTWKLEWPQLKGKLKQFTHHFNSMGKLHMTGSLDRDAAFMALVNDTAKRQLAKQMVRRRQKHTTKAAKASYMKIQWAPDVSFPLIFF